MAPSDHITLSSSDGVAAALNPKRCPLPSCANSVADDFRHCFSNTVNRLNRLSLWRVWWEVMRMRHLLPSSGAGERCC